MAPLVRYFWSNSMLLPKPMDTQVGDDIAYNLDDLHCLTPVLLGKIRETYIVVPMGLFLVNLDRHCQWTDL